jgi:CubicO group peptidase (beta-lactamase class C family)
MTQFRSSWHYNNLMYMMAGRVAEAVTGEVWESLVENLLFAPLG